MAASCPDNAIENEERYSVLLPLDYIPDLSRAGRETSQGKPNWERGTEFRVTRVPPFRSRGTDVSETPCRSESAHSPCAKHVDDSDRAKDQRQREKQWKDVR